MTKVAVVGATGLVGSKLIQVLEERHIAVSEFIPVASANSAGKQVLFHGKPYSVITPEQALELKPQIALFSAGGGTSLEWAPKFAAIGCYVIDNSSAWRMEEGIPLVVPEINADRIQHDTRIIANPNCSTIQMVMVLQPPFAALWVEARRCQYLPKCNGNWPKSRRTTVCRTRRAQGF